MSSFHILNLKTQDPKKDKYMKWKIWTWVITVVAATVIIKSYITDFSGGEQPVMQEVRGDRDEQAEAESKAGRKLEKENNEDDAEQKMQGYGNGQNVQEDSEKEIRVLIKTDNFENIFHENPVITCDGAFQVEKDGQCQVFAAGETYSFTKDEQVRIVPLEEEDGLSIVGLKRSQSTPVYKGSLQLSREPEGTVIINQLLLEEYLTSVLSSEMSASFPKEALKAQAVCARTYAQKKINENKNAYYGADLDDSVSYQVYNNRQASPETVKAVTETAGMILVEHAAEGSEEVSAERIPAEMISMETASAEMDSGTEEPAEVYYYSTSCGVTAEDCFDTEEAFAEFITSVRETDMEWQEVWYRWQAELSETTLLENLQHMGYSVSGGIQNIQVVQREENGRAAQLSILCEDGSEILAEGEYDIRRALSPDTGTLLLQDGSVCDNLGMLPSGWFIVEKLSETAKKQQENVGFLLLGGGYGHGNGLSQNGARCMAEQGKNFREILEYYYPDTQIKEE